MRVLASLLSALLLLAAPAAAQSEPRLALLIGNEDYPGEPGRLRRPHDDVATLRTALEQVGFNVTTVLDADAAEIETAVSEFGVALSDAGSDAVGFFYYAGHGAVANSGGERRNFMLPARATVANAIQVAQYGVRLDRQIDALENAGASALFIVYDACRNSFTRGNRGFSVETQRPGLLVAMSTMADATTPDDGAYAVALAQEITRPGQRAENAFINASQLVGRGRPNTELPTVAPALRDEFCFSECASRREAIAPSATSVGASDPAQALWSALGENTSADDYQVLVDRYPESPFAELAERRIGELGDVVLREMDGRWHTYPSYGIYFEMYIISDQRRMVFRSIRAGDGHHFPDTYDGPVNLTHDGGRRWVIRSDEFNLLRIDEALPNQIYWETGDPQGRVRTFERFESNSGD